MKFWGPFLHKQVPFLANIERCPKFLEYALTMFLYRFADYDLGIFFGKEGATEQKSVDF